MRLLYKQVNQFENVRIMVVIAVGMLFSSLDKFSAAEPVASSEQLPRIQATEVAAVMSAFEVRDGFTLDLVAAEPLVVDPVAMDFDAWGRAFVVEMRGYSERRPERLGRIKMLEDIDKDGSFDQSVVYAGDLPWPTAVMCYDGGIFVGATPDIFYFKDTDGDGSADIRQLVFTGFASASAPYRVDQLNMQAMLNSFHWGPDNRIHGATGPVGGKVYSPLRPDQAPLNLRGKDFSFDPKTLELRAESGGAQNGMSFDSHGRKFVCSNSDHLQYIVYDEAFAGLNPFIKQQPARISIAEDGPAAPVFRISPDEPWRIVRTKWRVAGAVRGPVEGGGTPSGYFTGATGATLYTGDAWAREYADHAFIADCGSNLIHRKGIYPKGHVATARRPAEESGIEFVRSSDIWFRPVQFSNAPDGNLYVMDMYREVIEHPWSLPDGIKQFLDLNSGSNRGRIYRIRTIEGKTKQRRLPGEAKAMELVQMLGHSNHWHRETARRLLVQRNMIHLQDAVRALLKESVDVSAQVNAVQVLHGFGNLTTDDVETVFRSKSSAVHLALLKLWGNRDELSPFDVPFEKYISQLILNSQTRFQATLLLSKFPLHSSRQSEFLWRAMSLEKEDKYWMQFAVLNAMNSCRSDFLNHMIAKGEIGGNLFHDTGAFYQFLGASSDKKEIAQIFRFVFEAPISVDTLDALSSLSHGMRQNGKGWSTVLTDTELAHARKRYLVWIQSQALDDLSSAGKIIGIMGEMMNENLKQSWKTMLSQSEWAILHSELLASLANVFSLSDLDWVCGQWSSWSPSVRQVALALMMSRDELLLAYLKTAQEKPELIKDLTFSQRRNLQHHRSDKVQQSASRLWDPSTENGVKKSVEDFGEALLLEADMDNGQRIFNERCASCHRGNGEGFALGPDLISIKTSGKNRILDSILYPNREVQPQYISYEIETTEGESVVGLIAQESRSLMVVKQAGGITQTIQRQKIASIDGTGNSIMPSGLLEGMTTQDVGDLLEYIVQLKR